MAPRAYNRRTPEQIVADLQAEIEREKAKIEARAKATDPILREIPKLQKRLRKFAQAAYEAKRMDIANATTGFSTSLDKMYQDA